MMNITKKLQRAFYVLVWRYLPACKEITRMVSASMDTNLSLREKVVMKVHILTCRACCRYREQIEFLGRSMREFEKNANKSNASEIINSKDQFVSQTGSTLTNLNTERNARLKERLRSSTEHPV